MLQAARILPVMCGPAYSPDRGAPGRVRHPLGADAAMGGVRAHPRDQLECLIRYTARGAVALERLAEDANGDLVYSFTKPWADGTTSMKSRR